MAESPVPAKQAGAITDMDIHPIMRAATGNAGLGSFSLAAFFSLQLA